MDPATTTLLLSPREPARAELRRYARTPGAPGPAPSSRELRARIGVPRGGRQRNPLRGPARGPAGAPGPDQRLATAERGDSGGGRCSSTGWTYRSTISREPLTASSVKRKATLRRWAA